MAPDSTTPVPVRDRSAESRGVVIGVVGASGGLGASSMAAILAVRGAATGRSSALIDGHPYGGGLDVLLGLDVSVGLRWPDLSAARGELDGAAIVAGLPSSGGCHLLSWDRTPGRAADNQPAVCAAVSAHVDVSVLDLPAVGNAQAPRWRAMCDHIVVLCGSGVRQLASAAVVLATLELADPTPDAPRIIGVLRQFHRGSTDIDAASALLGVPLVATIGVDRRVEVALRRGESLGIRSSPLVNVCDRVLRLLTSTEAVAA